MGDNREKLLTVLEKVIETAGQKESCLYTEEEKVRAAYALNMCMVSVSQIIDYNDLNILEQEYEGILNNLNLEMMPKDEALLSILKQLLDTITFFRLQEGDKKLLDREYQQRMKNAIWSAIPNFGLIVAGGNPFTMATSLASQVGIGYMNYRRVKCENDLNYEKQQWQLQRSAMEQFNGLRRELFDTAWRLADIYNFPDEYRLTERQIKQYDEILMDYDEIRKYERLTTIKDNFIAYPPFWYHYGSTANHIARDKLRLSDEVRKQYKEEACNHFDKFWKSNKYALLREDQLASACALEYIDLLDCEKDKKKVADLLDKAVKFSGNANDILQLCAVAYLRVGDNDRAADILRILVNENYNIVVNAQILSGLYVHKALKKYDMSARAKYETLVTRVNPDYLFRLPEIWEDIKESELQNEFGERQEELLQRKFYSVIQFCLNNLSIKLGKLIPAPESNDKYPDSYFSNAGLSKREKDTQELFAHSYNKKKQAEYRDKLYHAGFIHAYFAEMNTFFDMISEMNCLRDRQKLQKMIQEKIRGMAKEINTLNEKIEGKTIDFDDMRKLLTLTSTGIYEEFISEWKNQIDTTILGMNDMSEYAAADSTLRTFCIEHGIDEPDQLLEEGKDADRDTGKNPSYFSLGLLGEEGEKLQQEHDKFRVVKGIIKAHMGEIESISSKSKVYFHESSEFNTYFESSKLKNYKDILQKTIAVYDDNSIHNVDVLFTVDGIVPVIRNRIKDLIPYFLLASGSVQSNILEILSKAMNKGKCVGGAVAMSGLVPGGAVIAMGGAALAMGSAALDTKSIGNITEALQPMIDEICETLPIDREISVKAEKTVKTVKTVRTVIKKK